MKYLRDIIVNCIIAFTRMVFFWLPGGDLAQGSALRAFHPVFIITWGLLFFIYPSNKPFRIFVCMLAILTLGSQLCFRCCVITRAEQIMTGSNETVVDPFLKFIHIKPSTETRHGFTFGASFSVTLIMLVSVWIDLY